MSARVTSLAQLTGSGLLTGAAAQQRTLPLLPAFTALLPQAAVQQGSVVACDGSAAVSLALSLAAGPSQAGAWVGVAGLPTMGMAAAVELGVAPERLVMVTEPAQPFTDSQWGDVLAAMIDGFDVVLLGPGVHAVRPVTARRLQSRVQSRGAVLLMVGAGERSPFGADLHFHATGSAWLGLGEGHGVARGRQATVQLSGRRVPRPRHTELWLPTADGAVEAVHDVAVMPSITPVPALQQTG